ncbi:putative spindle assembly checkpoint component mad1 protein [Phaeoacremonium minimum UCRPA7]|uniref:Spindle assembly checkpoint component MAD1 n=1 Tax=Phaeoacremonium minimum (strain UCR-PA7) TaxID=1286976 RepID=R8BPC3_PHAM7|nr:putative spindle assembly checkpoint component mad1 protein [Phaeoacremonium minimum UCRPA7]EOO01192.1 putative spindle assembly checkpoint component mad1 protein [Phaeoacremonium minimum UCRPA7]
MTPSQRAISRESSKENLAPPDAEDYETQRKRIEELKAEIGTLRYTINNNDAEKEMARLQHETELRDAQRRAEEDFKKKQTAESDSAQASRAVERLQNELAELRSEKENQKRELDKRAREAEDEARLLKDQLEDLNAAKEEAARMAERKVLDLQSQITAAQRTTQELEEEGQQREHVLQKTQKQLAEKETVVGNLEAEVLRLKAQTGDAETMAVIRRELSDQVTHIRTLEATNREQLVELKHLRQVHKAVEIVEEEKASLRRKLEVAESLQDELAEERRQRQRLEDERLAWAAYLKNEATTGDAEFDSPEAVARALVQERYNSATLTEQLGALQPEISERDAIIKTLEDEKNELASQIEKLKTTGTVGSADKARARLDRQRALAVKEVEYLRAQLKTFDAEDITFQPENFDEQKAKRVQELEDLVDKYKEEVQKLHSELSSLESSSASPAQPAVGSKRSRTDDSEEHEQLGQLARKNRKLQEEIASLQSKHRLAQKELSVAQEQLAAAKKSGEVRILSLRSNPTSDFEAIKTETLKALKTENRELLAQIQGSPATYPVVPVSSLIAAQGEIEEAKRETASAKKSAQRLKEVWSRKSAEFKEAVFSALGWHVTFMPNGKMRVESIYHPSRTDEHENSIVFDGEKGTMKVGGGPRSAFAQRIGDNIKYWVREKECIPGFLASLTLEFFDEQTAAGAPPAS